MIINQIWIIESMSEKVTNKTGYKDLSELYMFHCGTLYTRQRVPFSEL